VVRDVRGADELRACQELQRRAWGITEDGYVLPVATMAGAQKVGGLILGAFDAGDRLVGFAFAFLGKLRGELILYSQLTGVHPAHQSTGVGRLLKFEQRRRAREMGLESVVWAFDPLQASNAAFNLGVLGAICRTYEVDMYGARSDTLNAGLATDRLLAEWPTGTDHAGRTEAWPDAFELIETQDAKPVNVRQPAAGAQHVSIQIPPSIGEVKSSPSVAQEWQVALRQAFRSAFDTQFLAVGFNRVERERPRYLLERGG
jgi:predicted GNAT superfamily acetyltransferase